jgi:SH3 domain-containing YSC84-like protein 1
MRKINLGVPGLLAFAMVVGANLTPARSSADEGPLDDARKKSQEASETLREMMGTEDHAIPDYLLERAQGIAVIPNTLKAAFGVGGRGGKGLISTRQADGWSAPLFVTIGGASFGLQIGGESTDIVMVFTDKKGLEALVKDKVKLGADVSVAAGPVGRNAEVGTNATMDSAIYSYSRSKGLFAGAALDGAVLQIDDSENQKVYGKKVDAKSILADKTDLKAPEVVQPFLTALKDVVPPPKGAKAESAKTSTN